MDKFRVIPTVLKMYAHAALNLIACSLVLRGSKNFDFNSADRRLNKGYFSV
jgi:hypothetical protein